MDLLPFMGDARDFIERHSYSPDRDRDDINVPVHCREGVSRSTSIAIAYLMRKHHLSFDEVLAEVKEKRKVKPSPNVIGQLRVWEAVGYQVWQDNDNGKIAKEEYQEFLDKRSSHSQSKGLTGDKPIELQSL